MHVCLAAWLLVCLSVYSGSTENAVKTTTYQCKTQHHADDLKKITLQQK
jgi:hypothetical protein